jgi:DNA polymerase-3 subunit delta
LPAVAEDLKPAYLLSGSDRPKITRALARLRARFDVDAVELLSAVDTSGDDAVAACNALGLFGDGGRLVVVEEVDGRRTSEGRLTGGWKAADVKAVATYLASPAPATVLALVGEELKGDGALAKACAKAGSVLVYEVPKRQLPKWVAEQFTRLEAQATPEACRLLIDLVGDELDELEAEIEKLAIWAAGAEIGEPEVAQLVAARAETPLFAVTDAWGRRDIGGVLAASEAVIEWSGEPAARVLPRLVGSLARHVARVQQCKTLDAEGVRPRDAAGRLKMHPFVAEKSFEQARRFSADELADATVRLARLDLALKGGSKLPVELELDRALIDITRGREPAARPGQ